jgi:restriction system protein
MSTHDLIPPHGGFLKLRSFQCAQVVYDGTVIFCNRFIDKKSRTHDQMVQAARSGVQNIAEGSMASATSKKIELKLTGIARASLGELPAEELANTPICLINQASYLLWQQLKYLGEDFLRSGGFTERMYHARKNYRNNR